MNTGKPMPNWQERAAEENMKRKPLHVLAVADLLKHKPTPSKKLWGNYWHKGQLCVVGGDTGIGKSLLAIKLGKAIAKGKAFLDNGHIATPQKVLYVGHELGLDDFALRFGKEPCTNFACANLNPEAFRQYYIGTGADKLIQALDAQLAESAAEVLIIDQPDRLYLLPAQWADFLLHLNYLKQTQGLSILVVVNNKPRHTSRKLAIVDLYRHTTLAAMADSIVGIGLNHHNVNQRYIKLLKNKAEPMPLDTAPLNVVEIALNDSFELLITNGGKANEEKMLPLGNQQKKYKKMIWAEELRHEGKTFTQIAVELDMPESTIRSWLRVLPKTMGRGEGREREPEIHTPPGHIPIATGTATPLVAETSGERGREKRNSEAQKTVFYLQQPRKDSWHKTTETS